MHDTYNLLNETTKLLQRCALSRPQIALRSGVGYEWLKKFEYAKFSNPGVHSVQRLHDFLVLHRDARGDKETPPPRRPRRARGAERRGAAAPVKRDFGDLTPNT
jgi:hypothetical protein